LAQTRLGVQEPNYTGQKRYGLYNMPDIANGLPIEQLPLQLTEPSILQNPQPQKRLQNILRNDVIPLKDYYNEDWGISFTTPPTWFYSINEHIPVILSCLWNGLIFVRFHRPQSEKDIKERYASGYSEKHLFFAPAWDKMIEIEESSRNRRKTLIGNYIERKLNLNARVISILSTFGDCASIFGVVDDSNEQLPNFKILVEAMHAIAQSVSYFPPKAPNAYDSLVGKYINQKNTIVELNRNRRFTWYDKEKNEYSIGRWDRMGNNLEGELHLWYDGNNEKYRVRFVVADLQNGIIKFDDEVFKKIES